MSLKDRFELGAAINEVIVLARSAITGNGVSVETRLADGLFPVQGDRVQVQQVLLNLVPRLSSARSCAPVLVMVRHRLTTSNFGRPKFAGTSETGGQPVDEDDEHAETEFKRADTRPRAIGDPSRGTAGSPRLSGGRFRR
jgi:hypothetical protein